MSTLGTDLFSQKLEFNKAATIESPKVPKTGGPSTHSELRFGALLHWPYQTPRV